MGREEKWAFPERALIEEPENRRGKGEQGERGEEKYCSLSHLLNMRDITKRDKKGGSHDFCWGDTKKKEMRKGEKTK